jgi:hypothetical protein
MFMQGYKTCKECGAVRKNYPHFESQWTIVQADSDEESFLMYFCPKCWGIPDPAAKYCKAHGHDWENGKCMRCGIERVKDRW